MNRRILAGLVTAMVMVLLIRSSRTRPLPDNEAVSQDASTDRSTTIDPSRSNPLEPAAARVASVIRAASAGDVEAYLDGFRDPIRARLDQEITEIGRAKFAAELKNAAAARRSHAVFVPIPDGPDAASVLVESVFLDRNERQTFRLSQASDGWRIVEVESTRSHEPKVKYGSSATSVGPEGIPVQNIPDSEAPPPR